MLEVFWGNKTVSKISPVVSQNILLLLLYIERELVNANKFRCSNFSELVTSVHQNHKNTADCMSLGENAHQQ